MPFFFHVKMKKNSLTKNMFTHEINMNRSLTQKKIFASKKTKKIFFSTYRGCMCAKYVCDFYCLQS